MSKNSRDGSRRCADVDRPCDRTPDHEQVGTVGNRLFGGRDTSLITECRASGAYAGGDEHDPGPDLGAYGSDLLRRADDRPRPGPDCERGETPSSIE